MMGIFGNEYITEGRKDTVKEITNEVSLFYAHLAKWIFIPTKQTPSWLYSINNSCNELKDIRKNEKGYFNDYIINYDDMNNKIKARLKHDRNTIEVIRSMDFQQLYRDFPTISSMLDTNYLRKYLCKYQYDKSIDVDHCIDE